MALRNAMVPWCHGAMVRTVVRTPHLFGEEKRLRVRRGETEFLGYQ